METCFHAPKRRRATRTAFEVSRVFGEESFGEGERTLERGKKSGFSSVTLPPLETDGAAPATPIFPSCSIDQSDALQVLPLF